ncbi:unnamed protein product [Symbiodinium natans]|uniref:Uncharacterized protein n=1 Tax=Symbiodinium natans TaxID=878477 RepID=A0A812JFY7_9DINO|nr:unnamed protein product [Symbiodinium natans]
MATQFAFDIEAFPVLGQPVKARQDEGPRWVDIVSAGKATATCPVPQRQKGAASGADRQNLHATVSKQWGQRDWNVKSSGERGQKNGWGHWGGTWAGGASRPSRSWDRAWHQKKWVVKGSSMGREAAARGA